MNFRKSVPAPGGISPGSAKPKNPNVTILFVEDILSFPKRDGGGIKLDGNFVMKPGTSMIQVYMTPKKQKPMFTGEGDVDELIVPHIFEGSHPGNSLEIRELIQNTIGKDVIILSGDCQGDSFDMIGTPCSPLRLTPSYEASDSKTGHTFSFTQPLGTGLLPALYEGEISLNAPFEVADANLSLALDNGFQYKLAQNGDGTELDVAALDLAPGDVVSLIGTGGANPFVLSSGAKTAAEVLLINGNWAALDNATIDLKVFVSGENTYLLEQKRS